MRDLGDGADVNVCRQLVVDLAPEQLRRKGGVQLEVRHLCQRVHAGIRAPGAVQLELLPAARLAHRAIDFTLDRPRIFLDLPATVAGARVLDQQLESRHFEYSTSRLDPTRPDYRLDPTIDCDRRLPTLD